MNEYRLLDCVTLEYDIPSYDLHAGDMGVIVQVYDDRKYEVEFKIEDEERKINLLLYDEHISPANMNLL